MNIYTATKEYFSHLALVQAWPHMQQLFERAASKQPRGWELPVLACTAVGKSPDVAIPVATAIGCLQISIILIDDLLDEDPRGEYNHIGASQAANIASAFQAAGLEAIFRSSAPGIAKAAILEVLNRMTLTTAIGQHLDVQTPASEQEYWALVRTKSVPFYATALQVGVLIGNAHEETVEQLRYLGSLYGEIIQIHDDLNDVMETPANPDWIQGRAALPILFAQIVKHPERERFLDLRGTIPDAPDALQEAQEILIRCGAVSYSVDRLLRRYRLAIEVLKETDLVSRDKLVALFDETVDPVRALLQAIGIDDSGPLIDP